MNKAVLVPFSHSNSETVLAWRNSSRVRDNSIDDAVITNEAHAAFLDRLAVDTSRRYFVVEINGVPQAVLSFIGIGTEKVIWGCYIGSEKVQPGMFPMLACIGIRYAFNFKSTRYLNSEVAEHNTAPLKFNAFLGLNDVGAIEKTTSSGRKVCFHQFSLPADQVDCILDKARKVMTASRKEMLDSFEVKK